MLFAFHFGRASVYRLSGLENGLLGLSSKVNAVVWAEDSVDVNNLDIICFGHLLYEMCTGYELTCPQPSPEKIRHDLDRLPQVNLFIYYLSSAVSYIQMAYGMCLLSSGWLHETRLLSRNVSVAGRPQVPLANE